MARTKAGSTGPRTACTHGPVADRQRPRRRKWLIKCVDSESEPFARRSPRPRETGYVVQVSSVQPTKPTLLTVVPQPMLKPAFFDIHTCRLRSEGTKHRGKQRELAFGLGLPLAVAISTLWSVWQLDFGVVSRMHTTIVSASSACFWLSWFSTT